jgi:predicted DCC family thiol-disulfide oxidoreductase YuxK
VQTLYVIVDGRCGLCTHLSAWLREQPAYVDLQPISSESEEAKTRFSALPAGELALVSDTGDVWLGDNAFLMCLWALRRYRSWANRLASPVLRPLARQAFAELSRSRHGISKLLGLRTDSEIREHLKKVSIPPCELP